MTLCSEGMIRVLRNWAELTSLTKTAGMALCSPLNHRGGPPRLVGAVGASSPALGLIPDLGRRDVALPGVPHLGTTAPPSGSAPLLITGSFL